VVKMDKEVFRNETHPVFEHGENLFQISLPLPNNPLKSVNTYLVLSTGNGRSLLIDTAFNNDECLKVLLSVLEELSVDLNRLDVFITHLHSDHSALCQKLKKHNKNIRFFASREDGEIINLATKPEYWEYMTSIWLKNGFPDSAFLHKMNTHLGWEYHLTEPVDWNYLKEGDVLSYGEFELKCIHTPGHTPGHLCLYDAQKKVLFAGDHILSDITPVIAPEYKFKNPLAAYLASLVKISTVEVKKILVGHRTPPIYLKTKAMELYEHHQHRLEEVANILQKFPSASAYEVASKMQWDLKYDTWEDFPPIQQWFATGEAMAHMFYENDDYSR
jgi:glyoxylase-like metal-dependent hydrolase (beta-lactamase superfamily II)